MSAPDGQRDGLLILREGENVAVLHAEIIDGTAHGRIRLESTGEDSRAFLSARVLPWATAHLAQFEADSMTITMSLPHVVFTSTAKVTPERVVCGLMIALLEGSNQ